MAHFYDTLPRPYLVLAPMADVTDMAFRAMFVRFGKPDILWTEFVSADGLYHTRELQKRSDEDNPLMQDLRFASTEHPIVAQLFSAKPEMIEYASALVTELGFDGVDINMGCPDRSVEKQGAGARLMKDPVLARALIASARKGTQGKIPVSVKTRVGYNSVDLTAWLTELLSEEPDALIVHARTRKEMSLVPARWEHVRDAVVLRDSMGVKTHIIGNGDICSREDAYAHAHEFGADGVMVGRGVFGNPWFFSGHVPTQEERLCALKDHCLLFEQYCGHKSFAVMKKHFKAYVHGFDGAGEVRSALMACDTAEQVVAVLERAM
jgi:nifR3 family TIM-barrel protein